MLYYMIMAGGHGSRMNSPELPKQFLKIGDEPILIKTVRNFEDFGLFRAGVICCPVDWIEYTKALLMEYGLTSPDLYIVPGGKNRNGSVRNGCRFLTEEFSVTPEDIVLTHDAVRPFINPRIIRENIAAVESCGAANTVMPVYDSVITSGDGEYIGGLLSREELFRVQTPQSFYLLQLQKNLLALTDEQLEHFTDLASVFSSLGFQVKLVPGEDYNIKITTPFDLAVAQSIVKNLP